MRKRLASGPHATGALYDRDSSRMVVSSIKSLHLAYPSHVAKGFPDAKPADLSVIEITPTGLRVHWPRLDADLSRFIHEAIEHALPESQKQQ